MGARASTALLFFVCVSWLFLPARIYSVCVYVYMYVQVDLS